MLFAALDVANGKVLDRPVILRNVGSHQKTSNPNTLRGVAFPVAALTATGIARWCGRKKPLTSLGGFKTS